MTYPPNRRSQYTVPADAHSHPQHAAPARSAAVTDGAPIRVLIVDDHAIMRSGYVMVLQHSPGFDVVGEAADGHAAVTAFSRLRPDVVLLDLNLPGLDGWQVLTRLRAIDPTARVLVVSAFGGDEDVHRALAAGAAGYLLKESSVNDVVAAIRAVANRGRRLSTGAAEALAERTRYTALTERETDVLRAMSRGESNKEIGVSLGVTENTVKGYVANVLDKLGVNDRTAAVSLAYERGLLHLPRRDTPGS
jgi:DNA-binding NarL/FixJ family response regulator